MSRRAVLLGLALAAGHAALLPLAIGAWQRDELRVRVTSPEVAETFDVQGEVPASLAARVRVDRSAPAGPGLERATWQLAYRGGVARRVGFTQLVGPFQDLAAPPCALRVHLSQAVLDDGSAGPGTVAHLARRQIEAELAGLDSWPIGRFRRVAGLRLRWDSLAARASTRPPPQGRDAHLAVGLTLEFERAAVPLHIRFFPILDGGALRLDTEVDAELDFDNRVLRAVSKALGGDRLARRVARREVDEALVEILAPPPELPLPDGHSLRFAYCEHEPIRAVPGQALTLPLALAFPAGPNASGGAEAGSHPARPIALGRAQPPALPSQAPLTLDLDLDLLNGALYELWRTGTLDRHLREVGLEARFDAEPVVRELLSLRVRELRLALPPTITGRGPDFELAAELSLALVDGSAITAARLFGRIGLELRAEGTRLGVDLRLRDLELTCVEPVDGGTALVPCYGDLVAAMRGRAGDLHAPLTEAFVDTFSDLVIGRSIATDADPTRFRIERAALSGRSDGAVGVLRVELFGALVGAGLQ